MPNVLLVERDQTTMDSMRAALAERRRDVEVQATSDGGAAIDILESGSTDVLVLDAGLRGGIDAVTVLMTAAARTKRVSVVVVGGLFPEVDEVGYALSWVPPDAAAIVEHVVAHIECRDGFGNGLIALEIEELLRAMHASRWTGALQLRLGRLTGMIVACGGEVEHAAYGALTGEIALREVVAMVTGSLIECDPPEQRERTIGVPFEDLWTRVIAPAIELRAERVEQLAVEITEDDLVEFLDDASEVEEPGFELFSPEELAELALDDTMAVGVPRKTSSSSQEVIPGDLVFGDDEDADALGSALEASLSSANVAVDGPGAEEAASGSDADDAEAEGAVVEDAGEESEAAADDAEVAEATDGAIDGSEGVDEDEDGASASDDNEDDVG